MKADSNPAGHWLGKLANLNAARTPERGIAPHKPLMLLTVIDLIEAGDITDGWVKYDVRLVSRFRDYWELVRERQRNQPDITMPFHALGGDQDRIWERFTADGSPSLAKATTRLCSLASDLFTCLRNSEFRFKARETLVTLYFIAKEQVMLCARLALPVPKTAEIAALREQAEEFKVSQKKGRDSRFKSDVLGGYYFTCALTGYRLDTETTSTRKPPRSCKPLTSTNTRSPGMTTPATDSRSPRTPTGCSIRDSGRQSPRGMSILSRSQ